MQVNLGSPYRVLYVLKALVGLYGTFVFEFPILISVQRSLLPVLRSEDSVAAEAVDVCDLNFLLGFAVV